MPSPFNAEALPFVALRAYGDFVIMMSVLERALGASAKRLVVVKGSHLAELANALQFPTATMEVFVGEAGVPSAFDVKKNGPVAAMASLLRIRRAIHGLPLPRGVPLLFDRVGLREYILAGPQGASPVATDSQVNIYLAYERRLLLEGLDVAPAHSRPAEQRAGVTGIFPGSRIASKRMPSRLVRELLARCQSQGQRPRVFLLEGETLDEAIDGVEMVPRRFMNMIAAVESVARVISADSLPAHLAERAGIGVFVVTPVPNVYWLPGSAYRRHDWDCFSSLLSNDRLDAFLSRRLS